MVNFVTIFTALDGGCLMVSNIGAPTQEGSLLRLNISPICADEGKGT